MRRFGLARFFFNVWRRGELIRDEEGDALLDVEAARALALDILGEMAQLPHVYGEPQEWRRNVFVITDESGAEVLTVPYDALL